MRFQNARETVLATCLTLAERGYLAGTGGNVALRADEDHFAVTPSATDYYAMTAADICVLRLSDRKQIEGEDPASVESGLHANVFKARPDCGASIHTHQPIASAYTLLGQPLRITDKSHQAVLGSTIPCVAYAPSGTALLAWRVGRVFGPGTHACLMRSHGVVCAGVDANEAINRVAVLESACAAFFHAHATDDSSAVNESIRTLVANTLAAVINDKSQETRV